MTQATATPFTAAFPAASEEAWRKLVEKALKGADFEKKLVSKTADGLRIAPLYPRREGAQPVVSGHAGQPWRVSARVDHPDPAAANAQALQDLTNGVDTLTLVFAGCASARGHGLACRNVADLDRALKDVDLSMIRIRVDSGPAGRLHAGLVAKLADARGLDAKALDISFGMDPLSALMSEGGLPASWPTVADRLSEAVSALAGRGFKGPFVSVDLRPAHEAGASEAQEIAAGLACGLAYLRALTERGMAGAEAARAIAFTVPVDADQFMGLAKLRALRRAWARILEASGITPEPARIDAETSFRMMSLRDPWVNMLRTTMATFTAGIGGADSLTVLPYTQALGLPDPFARRIARNQQTILIEESNVWRVSDPAAGSGGIEALTDQLAEAAWSAFQEIEREGGILASLKAGQLQGRIGAVAAQRADDIAKRKAPLTGVSEFPILDQAPVEVIDTSGLARLGPPRLSAGGKPETFAELLAALDHGLTHSAAGDTADLPERVTPLASHRLGEPYEALRDAADAHFAATGTRPEVFSACLGKIAKHTVRSTWIKNLMAAGGIVAEQQPGFESAQAAADAFKASGATIAVIASSDDVYAEMAADAAKALKAAGARKVLLAGRPGDLEAALKAAGVDGFIAAGQDMVALLAGLQSDLGIHGAAGGSPPSS